MIQVVPIILYDGSGTRLSPLLPRTGFQKQFLCLTGNECLFQQAARRLAFLGNERIQVAAPVIVKGEDHRFLASEHLREVGIALGSAMLEPVGSNTSRAMRWPQALRCCSSSSFARPCVVLPKRPSPLKS